VCNVTEDRKSRLSGCLDFCKWCLSELQTGWPAVIVLVGIGALLLCLATSMEPLHTICSWVFGICLCVMVVAVLSVLAVSLWNWIRKRL
jgi:hypothetical protein